jgi:signal transduction histidine kinase
MEGFRVLPYGDRTDDWLEIDYDYNRRSRSLRYLSEFNIATSEEKDQDAGLSFLPNANYFGAVFLTANRSGNLRMLVNREGFIPDASFANLNRFVRLGIDLLTRERAAANQEGRSERRKERLVSAAAKVNAEDASVIEVKRAIQTGLQQAAELADKAEEEVKTGKLVNAASHIRAAAERIRHGHDASRSLVEEQELMRILAALGLQMSAFVHEVNSLVTVALDVETIAATIRKDPSLSKEAKSACARLMSRLADLRRSIERQAAYLADISSPDARRRRSRQALRERFEVAMALLAPAVDRRGATVENRISPDHRTRAMFPAEVMLIFSNLLSNAIKAADKDGRVRVTSSILDGGVRVLMENTGVAVDVRGSERWFKPFASTTNKPDPYLGQGMGMGLPIVRSMIEEYGGSIHFVAPSKGFKTAIEIVLPA